MKQVTPLTEYHYPKITLGFTWLAVIPLSAWAISTIYIPLFSEHLNQIENWAVTSTILILMGLSLVCHALAHLVAAWDVAEQDSGSDGDFYFWRRGTKLACNRLRLE